MSDALHPITREATLFAAELAGQIRQRGWAGAVGIIGADPALPGGHQGTGAGTGTWFQMDVLAAAHMLAAGLRQAKVSLDADAYAVLEADVLAQMGAVIDEGRGEVWDSNTAGPDGEGAKRDG